MDKKAKIKAPVKIVTVPTDITRTHHIEPVSVMPDCSLPRGSGPWPTPDNQSILFEVACMKQLDAEVTPTKPAEEALKLHEPKYAAMVKSHPELLEPSFQKGNPTHGVWHKMHTADHAPCKSKRRPIIADSIKAQKGKEAWEKMLADGIIEKVDPASNTDWSSALHLADQPGGGVRPCPDFRLLNQKTVTDAHPLPLLKDFTKKIHGAKVFSKVDLRSAFFNIPIWPSHKHKMLTLSPWGGSYVFNRLPFGLSSGPSSWQKVLEWVLRDVKQAFVYLDDILLWGNTKQEHDKVLKEVLQRLASNKMALSIEKCLFGKNSVEYLGYHVSDTGIKPMPRKLKALEEFRQPTSQKDVLHFCGALNYFRTSLKGIQTSNGFKSAAAVLQPLYAVGTEKMPTKTKFKDIWENSPALKLAFAEAKQMLVNAVELHHPHPECPLALFSDASNYSVGGSLQMLAPDGSFKPLGFYSAHLTETQKKYSVFKKELLGAFKSLRHSLPEIYGRHCTIYVDHLPLVQAFKSSNLPLNDPQSYR